MGSKWTPPEGAVNRTEQEIEAGRCRAIDALLNSLIPLDASRALFSFAERKAWGLKTHRRYRTE